MSLGAAPGLTPPHPLDRVGVDNSVRSLLAERGMKKGDLSKFSEDAVKWRVLEQTMAEARAGFADLSSDAVDVLADEAVAAVRQARGSSPPKVG